MKQSMPRIWRWTAVVVSICVVVMSVGCTRTLVVHQGNRAEMERANRMLKKKRVRIVTSTDEKIPAIHVEFKDGKIIWHEDPADTVREVPFEQVSTIRWRSPGRGFLDGIMLEGIVIGIYLLARSMSSVDEECDPTLCLIAYGALFTIPFGGIGALFGGKYEVKVVSKEKR